MDFVYFVEAKNAGKLKKVLEENPYESDSFAKLGYVLKEKGGKLFVFFKTEDEALAKKLCEKLKAVEGASEAGGEEKKQLIEEIASEQDSAAHGIGSIFG